MHTCVVYLVCERELLLVLYIRHVYMKYLQYICTVKYKCGTYLNKQIQISLLVCVDNNQQTQDVFTSNLVRTTDL